MGIKNDSLAKSEGTGADEECGQRRKESGPSRTVRNFRCTAGGMIVVPYGGPKCCRWRGRISSFQHSKWFIQDQGHAIKYMSLNKRLLICDWIGSSILFSEVTFKLASDTVQCIRLTF